MDGIAVQSAATAFAPVVLGTGEYAAIDTGEALDERWDAVVPVEEIAPDPDGVLVRHVVAPGAHVRPAGEDVAAGTVVIDTGERLGPYDLALAAAVGHAALPVRVAGPRRDHPDRRRAAGARAHGSSAARSSTPTASCSLRACARRASRRTSSASSATIRSRWRRRSARPSRPTASSSCSRDPRKGRATTPRVVLERCGTLAVRRVALRPAHPVLLGAVGSRAVVGVPGYPVSAALTLERFVLPLLDRLSARRRPALTLRVRVTSELHPRRDSEVVVPLVLEPGDDGIPHAVPQSRRGGALSGLARAGATLRLPAGGDVVAAGSVVEAEPLSARR